MAMIPALLLATAVSATPHPTPAPAASPAPAATPVPVIMPPPGIWRPEWETVPSGAPIAPAPTPSGPAGLPHYVGLGPAERGLTQKLLDLVALIEGHLAARRLTSAGVALDRAERHVAASEAEHLVLKLHAAWQQPRVRLLDLRSAWEAERKKGLDAESQRLAAEAAKRVGAKLDQLARDFAKAPPPEATKRLEAARRLLAEAQGDPYLAGNPAWPAARAELVAKLAKLERAIALRVGQAQLLEGMLRMAELKKSADTRLAAGDWDGALGDLAALGEACHGFEHDLRELKGQGYDEAALVWADGEGELRGKAYLARVAAWRALAESRWDVVERARARARIREEERLRPPDPPVLPPAAPTPPPPRTLRQPR